RMPLLSAAVYTSHKSSGNPPLHHEAGFIWKNMMMRKSYFQMDPKIQYLATCMNTCGMKSFASRHGHGVPVHRLLPHVSFMASIHQTQHLASLVRKYTKSPFQNLQRAAPFR
ncbi:hypothetical protein A4J19_27555, partial [Salmonella enterica subsp. enterica serovar Oranienburg]|nr:hypothetical protein [Salmonella enterica subsp. enterica serovar Oranienburg]